MVFNFISDVPGITMILKSRPTELGLAPTLILPNETEFKVIEVPPLE